MNHRAGFLVIVIFILVIPFGLANGTGAKVVLVTGFEPFGMYPTNPSQIIAETLNGSTLNDTEIIGIVLPVNFTTSVDRAREAIEVYHPDLVISLGLNAKAKVIEVEKIGVNIKRYPKDDGSWSFPQRIDKSGPFLRISSFKVNDIVGKIWAADIPATKSFFAGSYICNALFYGLLGYAKDQGINTSIGFIHVPLLDSQDPEGMPLGTMVDAVKIAIQESLV
jgi:pyroglutamyl-peptidase